MAKGARASTVKRNNANLRAKIFGPAVDERTARLSAKLQELVAKPRPDQERSMDVDESGTPEDKQTGSAAQLQHDMDVDVKSTTTRHKTPSKRKSVRIEKRKIHKKPRNQVVFPTSAGKRKRIAQSKRKSV